MSLAALIAAQEEVDLGTGLRATLPMAGRTLAERQARTAIAAGATHLVLLVEKVPAALAAAVERLRRQGLSVDIARTVPDAIACFHPHEPILLIADGCIAGDDDVADVITAEAPALLVLPDSPENAAFERIDAHTRWAGIALTDSDRLAETAEMLGEWDLVSTLLRRLVQEDAARITARVPPAEGAHQAPVLVVGRTESLPVERAMLRRPAESDGADWVTRYFHPLIAMPLVGRLIARNIPPLAIAVGSVVAAWTGVLLAAFGYFWFGAVLLPLATGACAIARQIARVWDGELAFKRAIIAARHAAALVTLALLAIRLAQEGGWGWYLIAVILPLGLTGLDRLRGIESAVGLGPRPSWLASGDGAIWLILPLTIICGWAWMTALLALYSLTSFLWRFASAARQAAALSSAAAV